MVIFLLSVALETIVQFASFVSRAVVRRGVTNWLVGGCTCLGLPLSTELVCAEQVVKSR